ncbi:MAG: hypothetical protein QG616_1546 [Pseudomonadota bacterium]|nr:hypothetical protein [Pseudomonadota bacterium]MDQ5881715.1 hypothetical protein [Pseudomonadota bacterium]MDQ5903799.1 hypothetical protein [Pseudomonadota bacterium]
MPPEDIIRLRHMLEAIDDASSFIAGRQRGALDTDKMLLFALVRCVEIVGEAASRLSTEAQASAPAIPWPAIIGMRNRLIHAYFDVDAEIVWKTVTVELPALAAELRLLQLSQE